MSSAESDSQPFVITVRLRRGRDTRNMRIGIYSNMDEPDRIAPGRVLDAFVAAVETGLFGSAVIEEPKIEVRLIPEHRLVADLLTARVRRMSPPDFRVVLDMARASVPGIAGLEILEGHDDERVLIVRDIAPEAEATILDVDFGIQFSSGGSPSVTVRFAESPTPTQLGRATRLLRAWADLITLGAFPPADGRRAVSRLLEITSRDDLDLFARFDRLLCGHAAFEALFAAFDKLHEDAPIVSLEVTGGGR